MEARNVNLKLQELIYRIPAGHRLTAVRRQFECGIVFVALCITGCGGEGRLEVSPVRGQVMYDGRGVPHATVVFHPVGDVAEILGKMRPYAYADENGRFQLKMYVTGDGAPPGDYDVSIIATAGADRESAVDPQSDSQVLPRAVVQKYANPKTSGISVSVKRGENDLEPFELD